MHNSAISKSYYIYKAWSTLLSQISLTRAIFARANVVLGVWPFLAIFSHFRDCRAFRRIFPGFRRFFLFLALFRGF